MMGMKTANSTRKTLNVADAYLISLRALKSSDGPAFLGGSLVRTVRHAIEHVTAHTRAIMRIAHAKPMRGAAKRIIKGNMQPPTPPAVQATPVAQPRRTLNQWPTAANGGAKSVLADTPPRTLNDRNI